MNETTLSIMDAMNRALWVAILAAMPILLVAMGVGLLTGILQTATSIQEQTLAFIPKILAVLISIVFFGPWIARLVREMAVFLFSSLYRFVQ